MSFYILINFCLNTRGQRVGSIQKWLLQCGMLVHAISLGGSSFVEEEHQTWYFYWVTLLMLLLYNSATKFCLHLRLYEEYYYTSIH